MQSVSYDSNSVKRVVDICNGVENEDSCDFVLTMVKKCTQEMIWPENKFLPNDFFHVNPRYYMLELTSTFFFRKKNVSKVLLILNSIF